MTNTTRPPLNPLLPLSFNQYLPRFKNPQDKKAEKETRRQKGQKTKRKNDKARDKPRQQKKL